MTNPQQFPGQEPGGQQVPGQPAGQQFPGQPAGQQFPGQQFPGQQPPVYPGGAMVTEPVKKKKPWFARWWVWALAVILLIGAVNAMGQGGSNQSAAPAPAASGQPQETKAAPQETKAAPKAKLTLDEGWAMEKTKFAVYVNGYVSNNTDKAITNYVQITFDALDKQGANLGTCLANTNTIDANGKWKFKAICSGTADEIDQVRFKDLTGF